MAHAHHLPNHKPRASLGLAILLTLGYAAVEAWVATRPASRLHTSGFGRAEFVAALGVASLHDLHIWSVAPDKPMLSAHLLVKDLKQWETVLGEAQALLHERYGIEHVTLQPELAQHVVRMVSRDRNRS